MIKNAKDKKVYELDNALPDMSEAVMDFLQPIVLKKINKQQVNGYTQEIEIPIQTSAVVIPMSGDMAIKMEGERTWRWSTMYCLSDLIFATDDVILYRHTRYRIMHRMDYSQYGYVSYEMIEDYTAQ